MSQGKQRMSRYQQKEAFRLRPREASEAAKVKEPDEVTDYPNDLFSGVLHSHAQIL